MRDVVLIFAFALAAVFPPAARAQTLTEKLLRESARELATAARQKGNAARGAVLFAERRLRCANCHGAGRTDLLGPDLGNLGNGVTDQSLVDAILRPSKEIRKGFGTVTIVTEAGRSITGRIVAETEKQLVLRDASTQRRLHRIATSEIEEQSADTASGMPEKLVDQLSNRQQFLDLVRYVIEVVAAGPTSTSDPGRKDGGAEIAPPLRGLVLLNELNCVACHDFQMPPTFLPRATGPQAEWTSGRINPRYLTRFIRRPHALKPRTRMPDVLSGLSEEARDSVALALTHYIVSLSNRRFGPTRLADDVDASAVRGHELFHSVGCVACHSPRDRTGKELLPDTSVPLGPLNNKFSHASLREFLKDPHTSRPGGRMPNMQLTHWEARDLSHALLKPDSGEAKAPFKRDPALAAEGKRHFERFNCVRCHAGEAPPQPPEKIAVTSATSNRGCLSDIAGDWPRFRLDRSDRDAIRSALNSNRPMLTDEDALAVNLTAFRCLNCHTRGELGGVSDLRNPHFQTTNPNLGPQGRMPPTLTGVGAKLRPKWMRQVLVSARNIRPYVKTRMPQYGAHNVGHLVDLFQRADKTAGLTPVAFADPKEMRKTGLEMAGTNGLNCIVCHTFQTKPAATMPAVDLTEMAERLHKDWFHRYMRDPQRFSRNTVMPSFWPAGKPIRRDFLNGDSDLQIEALWQYLLDGRQARAPRGLVREPMELLAGDETVMLRRSYQGIGKRGIGVGYPSQVNLAFDAEQMRLAMVWRGKFADPGGVWRSQGHGTVRTLGAQPIRFLKGPDVDDAESPWVVDDGRPPRHQFMGYSLDENRRPTFKYRIDQVTVEDYFVDTVQEKTKAPRLIRTLSLQAEQPARDLVFRAADGTAIEALGGGVFRIDRKLRVQVAAPHLAVIVDSESGKQLQVPLAVGRQKIKLGVTYSW